VLALDPGFAVWVYVYVESHRVAADGAVLDIVLVSAPRNIHWHHDLLAARVTDIRSFKLCNWSSAAACFLGLLHVPAGTSEHIVARLEVIWNP
jgi:hypothetical protein